MKSARFALIGSGLAVALLVLALAWVGDRGASRPAGSVLVLHCAAGLKPPVDEVIRAYARAYQVEVQVSYGGSGAILANLQVAPRGDLFLPGDDDYIRRAREKGLVEEEIPLARMTPVIAVRKGNPKGIRSIDDLARCDLALANPEAAAIGTAVRELLAVGGRWEALSRQARVFKPTVTEVANDIRLGIVDAGIVWDATVAQYPELEKIEDPLLAGGEQQISIACLASSADPAAALRFARFLAAPDRGLAEFARFGYRPVEGDPWAETPEAVLFSGGVNRLAIEETVARFERREGAKITRVYNGCGILVSQMKAGQLPDAYFACDVSFLFEVRDLFEASIEVSETDMVILAALGNPLALKTLEDLARPGLRLGVANPRQSALGELTDRLLRKQGIHARVAENIRVQTPTADLLVNQMRTGTLDAVVVYEVNTSEVKDTLTVVPIRLEGATAVQPYAARARSSHRRLMNRLLDALRTDESRRRFESLGFRWRFVRAKP